ncbi:unnamed protein product [Cylindrotheca closterium]|uniref:Uncharacterized protein n=1 Tax=Cylindrotheca closterium TaxID=2856 RepID=A0AAD2CS17_9STRA|nr:unnamed protein product [Cylindrotheca closterium]
MPPSSELRSGNDSVEESAQMQPVRRSVKFDQTVEFSDKAVGRLVSEEEDEKAARIRARERHRLRREWSGEIAPSAPISAGKASPPARPVRKRSVGADTKPKSMAPSCPQRKRSIGLTTVDIPSTYRSK